MIKLKNVRPLINGKLQELSDILIDGDKINAILSTDNDIKADIEYDMNGNICASGYIDIHTHGGYGHDVMEGTYEAIDTISRYHLDKGTTTYCPTTLTADIPTTIKALENIRNYDNNKTARLFGAHLEGPFISKKTPGAHPPQYILSPDKENTAWVWENADVVSRVTVAPDIDGAEWFTEECVKRGIQVSAGHDASIDDEIYAMVNKGCDSVTHMTNCTSRPSRRTSPHKHLGLTEVGLICDKLICEIIADNRHVPNTLFEGMIYKLKGACGIALVSDSLAIAGVEGGEMYLGSGEGKQKIVIDDGVAILPSLNTYAGSVTPISELVRNIHNNIGISLEESISMGSLIPSKIMKMTDRGDIKVGYLADLNIINENAEILHTIFNGNLIK